MPHYMRLGRWLRTADDMVDGETARLFDAASKLIETARRRGADAADAAVVLSRARSAQVRLGAVEEIEASESEDLSLRVFVDGRVATVSTTPGVEVETVVERAIAMARVAPRDPYAGLADPSMLSKGDLDLDLYDDSDVASARLVEDAMAMEEAARAVAGVTNSGGASASAGLSGLALVTSSGFSGLRRRSGFSRSVSVVAGQGGRMQRDHDFDSRVHFADLDGAAAIGRRAGERAVQRLDPRAMATGTMPVIYDPRVSRSLVGHFVSAVLGSAIARGTSFLKDRLGTRVLPEGMDLRDEPLLARRSASRPFDGEGVRGSSLALVEDGVLQTWLLDSATARELGLATNGRASRSGSGVSPSSTNVVMGAGRLSPAELIAETSHGIYVSELIGHGANVVTGDYSRGASGFMIENGELTHPISEFTIAGNLSDMLLSLTAANDLDERFAIVAPTLRVDAMTVAGR